MSEVIDRPPVFEQEDVMMAPPKRYDVILQLKGGYCTSRLQFILEDVFKHPPVIAERKVTNLSRNKSGRMVCRSYLTLEIAEQLATRAAKVYGTLTAHCMGCSLRPPDFFAEPS